ncbi:Uncharacterized protein FWK35_00015347, partial [Aphis craccivora]
MLQIKSLDFESSEDPVPVAECIEENYTQDELNCALKDLNNEVQGYNSTQTRDFSAQVCSGDLTFHFILLLDSDKKLNTMTGIPYQQISDAIMVDRGFRIDDICNEKGVTLIRPPFLRGKSQFTKTEALLTKEIASARVHIERVNQRLKTFKILQNK